MKKVFWTIFLVIGAVTFVGLWMTQPYDFKVGMLVGVLIGALTSLSAYNRG